MKFKILAVLDCLSIYFCNVIYWLLADKLFVHIYVIMCVCMCVCVHKKIDGHLFLTQPTATLIFELICNKHSGFLLSFLAAKFS